MWRLSIWAVEWTCYITFLNNAGFRLSNLEVKLVWSYNMESGQIYAISVYAANVQCQAIGVPKWWYLKLWKWHNP